MEFIVGFMFIKQRFDAIFMCVDKLSKIAQFWLLLQLWPPRTRQDYLGQIITWQVILESYDQIFPLSLAIYCALLWTLSSPSISSMRVHLSTPFCIASIISAVMISMLGILQNDALVKTPIGLWTLILWGLDKPIGSKLFKFETMVRGKRSYHLKSNVC